MTSQRKKEFLNADAISDRFNRIITQLKALATQAAARYEDNANIHRIDAPVYRIGQRVYVNVKNLKTNRPVAKLDDKWVGPFVVVKAYKRACLLRLPDTMRVFPVFHTSLLQAAPDGPVRPGQQRINDIESRQNRGRILERDDETEEEVVKWLFEALLDSRRHRGTGALEYHIQWKHHPASWQPASDLRDCQEVVREFHAKNPNRPGPQQQGQRPALLPAVSADPQPQPRQARARPPPRPPAAVSAPTRRSARIQGI